MDTPLGPFIESRLSGHGWNLIALTPHHLPRICEREGVRYTESPLTVNGLYVPPGPSTDNLPTIVINSELRGLSKSFTAYAKLARHFTPDPAKARALSAIALCPTWLLDAFSRRLLRHMGYCEEFLDIRFRVREDFPDVPARIPQNLDVDYPDIMAGLHEWRGHPCNGFD